ncbi:MAG: PadR family transcriptional regulator [Lactobacillaceae bacterium]|jgi:DNA-binding PadR family transcriptional regulator|nr:PadR family transcriptional regulator [Lactobacillaceae bacterium]
MSRQISSDLLRGNVDSIVLSTLLKNPRYGFEIFNTIKEKTDNQFELKEATLYSSYKRLELQKDIESYWGDETKGARRKYYRITKQGRKTYKDSLANWEDTKKIIDRLIAE